MASDFCIVSQFLIDFVTDVALLHYRSQALATLRKIAKTTNKIDDVIDLIRNSLPADIYRDLARCKSHHAHVDLTDDRASMATEWQGYLSVFPRKIDVGKSCTDRYRSMYTTLRDRCK